MSSLEIRELLQDETRLAIFLYLMANQRMTLKQLSEILNKGKTTIHFHIKRMEEINLVSWEEKEEKRTLKTRHYFINSNTLNKAFNL